MRLRAQCIDDGSCDPASAEVRTEQLRAADATPLTLQCGLNVPPHVKCVGLPLFLFDLGIGLVSVVPELLQPLLVIDLETILRVCSLLILLFHLSRV